MNTMTVRDSMIRTASLFVLIALNNAACGVPAPMDRDASTAPAERTRMERVDACRETVCQRANRECRESIAPFCNRCHVECLTLGASADSCIRYCRDQCECDIECTDAGSACGTMGYSFLLPAAADATLQTACRRAADRGERCSEPTIAGTCDINARVERPEHARIYGCLADVTCGGDRATCSAALQPGTLGDELCAAVANACSASRQCGENTASGYNHEQPWLRDDSLAAIRSCASLPECEMITNCVDAWLRAVDLDR